MKIHQRGIILILTVIFFASCQSAVLFEETRTLPLQGWNQDNIISYSMPVEDTIGQYELSLIIRNDARYAFSNLFLFINTTAPGGQGIRDTVEIRMADERGKWFGNGIGGKYTLEVPFKTQVVFPQKGIYRLEIEQGMRERELEFITDVGISIKKINYK